MATGDEEINWDDNFSQYQTKESVPHDSDQAFQNEDDSLVDAPMSTLLVRKQSDEDGMMYKAY